MAKINKNARTWLNALRSGLYKQTREQLVRSNKGKNCRFCCLGVACDLYEQATGAKIFDKNQDTYDHEAYFLPDDVRAWLGLNTQEGSFGPEDEEGQQLSLADLNDKKLSFATIADIIESKPQGLFE